jgi:hypothetical protein
MRSPGKRREDASHSKSCAKTRGVRDWISHKVLSECEAPSHRFHSACQVLCRRCEQSHPRRINRNLHSSTLLLRAPQLARSITRNNSRSDCGRKIGQKIVALSSGQADQNLSSRTRSQPDWTKAGRRRHENTRRHLRNRQAKCAKQFSPRATHFLSRR